jgi:hypothetical protein
MKLVYIFLLLISLSAFGQQKGFNYQAVILDPNTIEIPGQVISGQPFTKGKVWVRFTLLSQSGVDYEEIQQTATDEFGLINLTIGAGSAATTMGTEASSGIAKFNQFDAIVWDKNLKRLRVSVNFTGSGKFTEVSNQLMTFSPYSLYAESVDYKNVRDTPTSLSFFKNDVGYLVNNDLDPLKKEVNTALQGVQENSTKLAANEASNKARFVLVDQSVKQVADLSDQHSNELKQVASTLNEYGFRIQQNTDQIQSNSSSIQGQIGYLQAQVNSTQNALSNLSNNYESAANKSSAIDLGNSNPSNSLYPTQRAVKSYVDNTVSAATSNGTPDATTLATGKLQLTGDLSGTATAPTVPGLALKESLANKSTDVAADGVSNTKYPSVKAVKDYVDLATNGVALQTNLNAKADLNSPSFTGTPTLPSGTIGVTQSPGNNSTAVATTAFVQTALSSGTVVDADANTKGKVQLAGDLAGSAAAPVVAKLQGITVSAANPTVGQVLKYNGTAWIPDVSVMSETQTLSFSGSTLTISGTNSSVVLPTASDATTSSNGMVRLAGDLGGTGSVASAPVISDDAINTSKLANGAVTDAKFSGTLTVAKGGTGTTSLNGMIKGNGSSALSQAVLNSDYSLVRFVSDEITVTSAGQTSFTLTQSPNTNSVISFFINGVRISKTATTVSGNILTYNPANNGAASLVLNDRVQIDYYY